MLFAMFAWTLFGKLESLMPKCQSMFEEDNSDIATVSGYVSRMGLLGIVSLRQTSDQVCNTL